MKFVFDYQETLLRRVTIESNNLSDALRTLTNQIDDETIVLDSTDFIGGKISLPLEDNSPYFVRLEKYGETVDNVDGLDIVLEEW